VKTYLGESNDPDQHYSLDECFAQFRQFGKNNNDPKAKFTNISKFEELLRKEHIKVIRLDDEQAVLKGYFLKKEVARPERSHDESFYIQPEPKRARIED
jgi:hypothetical protein